MCYEIRDKLGDSFTGGALDGVPVEARDKDFSPEQK